MNKVALSKNGSATIDTDSKNGHYRMDTMTNRSPSDFMFAKSTKNSDYNTSPPRNKVSHHSLAVSPDLNYSGIPSLKKRDRYNNMSMSPKKLNFKKRTNPHSALEVLKNKSALRNKFNIKEVVYSDNKTQNANNKSVMQILKENNDEKTLKDEITVFDNFEFPKDMRITSNMLEMHPQILKDKLRISKFIHKYFNPTLYERNNMKAIKTIMKLDNDKPEPKKNYNIYEPYNKVQTELQAMKEASKLHILN
jgi:hypothetical protein